MSHQYIAPCGDDDNDGLTPETAKRSLGAALKTLGPGGGTVYCAPGHYPYRNEPLSGVTMVGLPST